MAFPKVRRWPHLLCVVGVSALLSQGVARAGKNDLQLGNLCAPGTNTPAGLTRPECSWVQRDSMGRVTGVALDSEAASSYRSLMSELGVAIAPRLMTPADTLGYAGFQFSAELGVTKISNNKNFWDGTAAVTPGSTLAARPDSYLTTVGGFVRKGLWLPLPAFEFGAGALSILGSRMYALQGYAKMALQEGFHGWWLPSFAVRGSASQLLGTSDVDMIVYGVDLLASKAFAIGGTARIEPYFGWSMLFIDARSGVIDATPNCDAYASHAADATAAAPSGCTAASNGTWDDLNANFTFPKQDAIMRQRWFGGFKLRLSVLFVAAQLEIVPAGTSRDDKSGAADRSNTQQTYSLSGGFDF
jgi:hypothetical protein